MKVILTGGGTGGHIYPAVAIADKIKNENEDAEILFVGTQKGLESTLVPENGYEIKFITVSGFNRKNIVKNVKVVKEMFEGTAQAKKIIRDFEPDFVIGTGGYVCGPVVRIASKMGIPCFIHEQNAFAGLTNKLLEKYVQKVFLGFSESAKYFKDKEKLHYTGNPVRDGFFGLDRKISKKDLGIDENVFTLLCFGGSRGSTKINDCMVELANDLGGLSDVKLFFVTGNVHYDSIYEKVRQLGIDKKENIEILRYIDDMPKYLGAADLVVCRSGALTVAELMVCGRAAVLIPSPNVTGNHQYHNAKAMEDAGAAKLILEKDLNSDILREVIVGLRADERMRLNMEIAGLSAVRKDAVSEIYEEILTLI